MKINKPKAILFDMDNTLVDTWPVMHIAIKDTMVAMGIEPWEFEKSKINMHTSLREYFPKIFNEIWERAAKYYYDSYIKNSANILPLPEVEKVLDLLYEKKIYTSIISNKKGIILRDEISNFFVWGKYFHKVIGANDAAKDKPNKEPIALAMEGSNININQDDVWYIGDTITDIKFAKNTNCKAVLFGDIDLCNEIFEEHKPSLHFRNHNELYNFLIKIL